MQEEIKNWIEQAEYDFDAAKYNLEGKKLAIVALLTQQSMEKALKALFIKRKNRIPKIHDLSFLGKELELPEHLQKSCNEITPYYMETRYPDAKGFKKFSDFT